MLWLDFECGGLDPSTACPLEIALVSTDKDGNILKSFESKIKPSKPVQPAAAAVNGYTEEKWKDAPNLAEVKQKIVAIFASEEKYMPAGWNTPFDLKWWDYFGFGWTKIHFGYHPYDLFGAYYPRFRAQSKVKLENVYEWVFSQKLVSAHTAMGDVQACISLYKWYLETLK